MKNIIVSGNEKDVIKQILVRSFDQNKSVRYLTGEGKKRKKKLATLIDYSIKIAGNSGKIYLSEDQKACALVVFPHQKKATLRTSYWDVQLISGCIGLRKTGKILKRERIIKKSQPKKPFYYLWYIGVFPEDQGQGRGSLLLNQILKDAEEKNMEVCLETSTLKNIPWYQKHGFTVYDQHDFGYTLFFIKNR